MFELQIVSGFLGSGKTTFLNRYIPSLDGKNILIENEFGDTCLDSYLVGDGIKVFELYSGCICCSLTEDLVSGIRELEERFHPDRIIIEPSGVAKLSDLIANLSYNLKGRLKMDYKLGKIITFVDISAFDDFSEEFGEFYKDQIRYADAIVFTIIDGLSDESLDEYYQKLRAINSSALIVKSDYRRLDDEEFKALIEKIDDSERENTDSDIEIPGIDFSSFSTNFKEVIAMDKLAKLEKILMSRKNGHILRAKGILKTEDGLKLVSFQADKFLVEAWDEDVDISGKFVIIGTGLNKVAIKFNIKRLVA